MRRTLGAIVLLAVAISAARAAARCGDAPGDAAAVAQARAAIGASCPCAAAASHRDYVTCADGVLKAMPQLPRVCRSVVRHCVARSTCGKPGTFTCCRTSGGGHTTCRLVTSPGRCAGPGECVGTFSSCCDACTAGGCATTTTTTTTTTTSPCGNGIIDPGELCDGTNLGICGSVIGHCGSPGEPLACQCCVPGDRLPSDLRSARCPAATAATASQSAPTNAPASRSASPPARASRPSRAAAAGGAPVRARRERGRLVLRVSGTKARIGPALAVALAVALATRTWLESRPPQGTLPGRDVRSAR
jgi:hypothetical protein